MTALPPRQGLYDPQFEHDACGLGFVATLKKQPTHAVVTQALEILANLTHRGAAGCDPCTGDGAGILLQIPHALFAAEAARLGFPLPGPGDYGVAMCFLSHDPGAPAAAGGGRSRPRRSTTASACSAGATSPSIPARSGRMARASMPVIRQLFIGAPRPGGGLRAHALHRSASAPERLAGAGDFYIASCSSRTVVYKGLMLAEQVAAFYPDLSDPRTVEQARAGPLALLDEHVPDVGARAPVPAASRTTARSTRSAATGPGCARARRCSRASSSGAHRGLQADHPPGRLRLGVARQRGRLPRRDGGRSLPHVMMMLVPEAFADDPEMSAEKKRAFYEYHGCLVEPWDGPAALCFTDGDSVGATLDRNGLRPAKYVVTTRRPRRAGERARRARRSTPRASIEKGRLQPGKMFLVDTERGARRSPTTRSSTRSRRSRPYRAWLDENKIELAALARRARARTRSPRAELARLQQAFGYTDEDLQRDPRADGDRRRGAGRLDGRRHPARGALASARSSSSATSSSSSRRSRTRRSIRSARRS